ncbi:MAG: hypothetical protein MK085_09710, partial [Phycisphaerales bacterium]|nr:hypothetical protein [Phycisphaerales bacterium]
MTTSTETPVNHRILGETECSATIDALVNAHGEDVRETVECGVRQCAVAWQAEDGDAAAFTEFCLEHLATNPDDRVKLLDRLETAIEQIRGHLYEMRRNLRRWSDLVGEQLPKTDALLATFDPAPDLIEQFYAQKLAFVALLNFRKSTLDQMLDEGNDWDTDRWAEARITGTFGPRIPKSVSDLARELHFKSSHWVSNFHVPVGALGRGSMRERDGVTLDIVCKRRSGDVSAWLNFDELYLPPAPIN